MGFIWVDTIVWAMVQGVAEGRCAAVAAGPQPHNTSQCRGSLVSFLPSSLHRVICTFYHNSGRIYVTMASTDQVRTILGL
jgi:hypothetical protein